jgi:hypothetical protein
MKNIFQEIFDYVKGLTIIDSHEHLPYREDARRKDTDVIAEYLIHYFSSDLISAGLDRKTLDQLRSRDMSIMEKWDMVEHYWNICRYTGYGRALDISVKGLYGINKISRDTIEELDDAFQKSLNPGHFKRVLKDMSKIEVSLLDQCLDCDPDFFRSVYRLDSFIYPRSFEDIKEVEKVHGVNIRSMDDWLEACESSLDEGLRKGAVALKSGIAYDRSLRFEKTTLSEARSSFNQIYMTPENQDWNPYPNYPGEAFHNYMMHYILKLANSRGLIYQFHTGLQEGNGNIIYNSDPSLLSNLFLEYPDVQFDLFHIGYPYQHVLSALAKNFPNVFIDMCWAHIISPQASVDALREWIDSVPLNKITAFGGDYLFVDAVYGHQYIARKNVSRSLTYKVEEGVFDTAEAKQIAKMLFYDNPKRIFKLS